MRPPKEDWRNKFRKPADAPLTEKYKRFKVEQNGLTHFLSIFQKGDLYTISIALEKELEVPPHGLRKKHWDMSAKDLNFLKESARDFLKQFGEYSITPID